MQKAAAQSSQWVAASAPYAAFARLTKNTIASVPATSAVFEVITIGVRSARLDRAVAAMIASAIATIRGPSIDSNQAVPQ